MANSISKLSQLGLTQELKDYIKKHNLTDFTVGRVIKEHKERYVIQTKTGEFDSEITGNMRFTAESREDFPAVGDWVLIQTYDENMAIIHKILPRFSIIKRQAVGQFGSTQIIASNIDYAFIMMAVDLDFNLNRLERYFTICHSSNVDVIVILTKIDLISNSVLNHLKDQLIDRIPEISLIPISNETNEGVDLVKSRIKTGKTYCLLGSSGVGKSSLVNKLLNSDRMQTGLISDYNYKGKHVTTHRELIVLANGGILIDNPGMREIGITDSEDGLETTFDQILSLANGCKYSDCTHTVESDCAVIHAVKTGELSNLSYQNFLKLERERAHYESTLLERKKRDKELGKLIKNMKKQNIKGRK